MMTWTVITPSRALSLALGCQYQRMDAIEIRAATPGDARAVADDHDRCFTKTYSAQLLAGELEAPGLEAWRSARREVGRVISPCRVEQLRVRLRGRDRNHLGPLHTTESAVPRRDHTAVVVLRRGADAPADASG